MSDEVLVAVDGAVMTITINRPDARNAINRAVSVGIAAALDTLDGEDALQVGILTGAGGVFSAGMDLKAFVRGEQIKLPGRGLGGICEAPPRKPMIAAVEGWALAGGCEVALSCDLIVASTEAQFGIPEVKRGLVAAGGGLIRLPRRIPPHIATEMALTGDPITAEAAHRYGLVNRLTPPGEALTGARALADRITPNGPLALAISKRILTESADWRLDEAFERQADMARLIGESADAREGSLAFAERRAPKWTGH